MATNEQSAGAGNATYGDAATVKNPGWGDTGVEFPATGQVALIAGGVEQFLATSTGFTLGPAAIGGIAFGPTNRVQKWVAVPVTDSDAAAGLFSWLNPEAGAVIVNECIFDVTTVASGTCTVSVGSGSSPSTLYSNLISGQDVHSATGAFTAAKAAHVATGNYVNGSVASGGSGVMVATAYLGYFVA